MAPAVVADTGVNDGLSFRSVRSPPTHRQGSPTPPATAKGRGHHGCNRASRSKSGREKASSPDLARNSKRRPTCRPCDHRTRLTPPLRGLLESHPSVRHPEPPLQRPRRPTLPASKAKTSRRCTAGHPRCHTGAPPAPTPTFRSRPTKR